MASDLPAGYSEITEEEVARLRELEDAADRARAQDPTPLPTLINPDTGQFEEIHPARARELHIPLGYPVPSESEPTGQYPAGYDIVGQRGLFASNEPGVPAGYSRVEEDEEFPDGFSSVDDPDLGELRTAFLPELENPQVRELLAASTIAEVGDQPEHVWQAYMESVFNRANARRISLTDTVLDPDYYPSITHRRMSQKMGNFNDEEMQQLDRMIDDVVKGSNITNFATGNESGDVHSGGAPVSYDPGTGERYVQENDDREWVEQVSSGKLTKQSDLPPGYSEIEEAPSDLPPGFSEIKEDRIPLEAPTPSGRQEMAEPQKKKKSFYAETPEEEGLTPRGRLIEAIAEVEEAGYTVPHFIGLENEPEGDRGPTRDMEQLVAALARQQTNAVRARDLKEAARIGKERQFWENQIKTTGMSAEQWKKQTGEEDPRYPHEPAFTAKQSPEELVNHVETAINAGKEVWEGGKRGLTIGAQSLGEMVNRYAYSPIVHGIREAIDYAAPGSSLAKVAKHIDDSFYKNTVEIPKAQREQLQKEIGEMGTAGQVAGAVGTMAGDLPSIMLTSGLLPELKVGMELVNTLRHGAAAMTVPAMRAGTDAAEQVKKQGGNDMQQLGAFIRATTITMGIGAVPMATKSGAPSLAGRIAERSVKSIPLASAAVESGRMMDNAASDLFGGEKRPFELGEHLKGVAPLVLVGGVAGRSTAKSKFERTFGFNERNLDKADFMRRRMEAEGLAKATPEKVMEWDAEFKKQEGVWPEEAPPATPEAVTAMPGGPVAVGKPKPTKKEFSAFVEKAYAEAQRAETRSVKRSAQALGIVADPRAQEGFQALHEETQAIADYLNRQDIRISPPKLISAREVADQLIEQEKLPKNYKDAAFWRRLEGEGNTPEAQVESFRNKNEAELARISKLTGWHPPWNIKPGETIKYAASRDSVTDKVYVAGLHIVAEDIAAAKGIDPMKMDRGFLTSEGRFVGRQEALEIAKRAKQENVNIEKAQAGELFGENIKLAPESVKRSRQALGIVADPKAAKGFEQAREEAKAIADYLNKAEHWGPWNSAVGNNVAAEQKALDNVMRQAKAWKKEAPDEQARQGMTMYREADGDIKKLIGWGANVKNAEGKAAYRAAGALKPNELSVMQKGIAKLDTLRKWLNANGINVEEVDNYITHMFQRGGLDPRTGLPGRSVSSHFKYAKQRHYDSYFQAFQAGEKPKTLDFVDIVSAYEITAMRAVNNKKFVDRLKFGQARDGNPIIGRDGTELRHLGYKRIENVPGLDGLVVHPDHHRDLSMILGRSRFAQWLEERGRNPLANLGKGIIQKLETGQKYAKGTMFSFSIFHQITEGTHALGHRVNPFNLKTKEIDLNDPEQYEAAVHGLMLRPDRASQEQFIQGSGSTNYNLVTKVARKFGGQAGKDVANLIDGYTHFLFEDWIPRLKMDTYRHIVERNMARFADDLKSGKMTPSAVKSLSADQANAAYGHLNYTKLARSPTAQHIAQLLFLAPDFFEARARFAGQAGKGLVGLVSGSKTGTEQLVALAVLAGGQYLAARILNYIDHGDYEMDPEHAFSVKTDLNGLLPDKRWLTLRSVPEDIIKAGAGGLLQGDIKLAAEQAGRFGQVRLAALPRLITDNVFGSNWRGERTDFAKSLRDMVGNVVPMPVQGWVENWASVAPIPDWVPDSAKRWLRPRNPQSISPGESLLKSMGLQIHRVSPINDAFELKDKWLEVNNPEEYDRQQSSVFPASKYRALRYALEDGEYDAARTEAKRLREGGATEQTFHQSLMRPFTGSYANDQKLYESLDKHDKAIFDAALRRRVQLLARYHEQVDSGDRRKPVTLETLHEKMREAESKETEPTRRTRRTRTTRPRRKRQTR